MSNPNLKTVCDGCSANYIVKHDLPDDYIEQFVSTFDENFSHEEIKYLLNFYKSDIMKKYNTIAKNLFTPIYEGFLPIIKKTIENC